MLDITIEEVNSKEMRLLQLIVRLDEEFNELWKRLEKLYKSVADPANKETVE
jgi:hypothetical protein